ncbi:MAG: glycosyltransferase family 2 protein [Thermodesulfobacteriota bacterium]
MGQTKGPPVGAEATLSIGRPSGSGIDRAKIWLVMPAYNEGAVIGEVLDSIEPHGYRLVVVDDASDDDTLDVVRSKKWVDLLRHSLNLGQGAALQTGLEYALRRGAEVIVTVDADGQHSVEDIAGLVRTLLDRGVDIVLGSRFLAASPECIRNIPRLKRWLLRAAIVYIRFASRLRVTDAHNGLRAMTAAAARRIDITQNRMAHATEILIRIRQTGMSYLEAPVSVLYTEYSRKKGQKIWNSINILWESLFGGVRR